MQKLKQNGKEKGSEENLEMKIVIKNKRGNNKIFGIISDL